MRGIFIGMIIKVNDMETLEEKKHYNSNKLFVPELKLEDLLEYFFKCVLEDDFYFISIPEKRIVGYPYSLNSEPINTEIFEQLETCLREKGYNVRYNVCSSAYGVFNAIFLYE